MTATLPAKVTYEALVAAQAIQKKRAAEESLAEFVKQAWHVMEPATPFVPGIHVDAICGHLQAVTEGRIKDLLINVAPGSGKSLWTSVMWPAWVWGPSNRPEVRWLFSSYREALALRDSVKCRALIQSPWYQDRWGDRFQFDESQNQTKRYQNTKMGYRATTSVGTGTGERCDFCVCDDPTSVDQADSDAERTTANEWWLGTMSTRLNSQKTGHFVVIQQRLHEDDLTGTLLARGSGYELLMLQEEFEPDAAVATSIWKDPRTKRGDLMWPAHRGDKELARLKLDLGSYKYHSQYQQKPSPLGGGIFKSWWWRFWKPKYMDNLPPVRVKQSDGSTLNVEAVDLPESFGQTIQSWDFSFKGLDTSDYVVGQVWGAVMADRYLLTQVRDRMDFPASVAAVKKMTAKHPKALVKIVEDKANGSAIISELKHKIPGIVAVNPDGGKITRANAVSPQVESGNVYLPHPAIAPWVEAFIHENSMFPNGRNDDQVDCMTQALRRLMKAGKLKAEPEPEQARVWNLGRGGSVDTGGAWMA